MFDNNIIKNLNQTEASIYDFVMNNHNKISFMTIRELSELCNVSTTSVLNFCKKIGCTGYNDFKTKIKEHLSENAMTKMKVFSESLTGFFQVSDSVEYLYSIKKLHEFILNSEAVLFVGLGTSGILAEYSARCLSNVGLTAHFINDPEFPVNLDFYKKWLVVFFSVSGETPLVLKLATNATNKGIETYAITSNAKSRITGKVKNVISYNIKQKRLGNDYDLTSQLPLIFIIEVICNLTLSDKL